MQTLQTRQSSKAMTVVFDEYSDEDEE